MQWKWMETHAAILANISFCFVFAQESRTDLELNFEDSLKWLSG